MIRNGRVYLDINTGRPHYIHNSWLYYWLDSQRLWTTLRKIQPDELFPDNLIPEQQDMYFKED